MEPVIKILSVEAGHLQIDWSDGRTDLIDLDHISSQHEHTLHELRSEVGGDHAVSPDRDEIRLLSGLVLGSRLLRQWGEDQGRRLASSRHAAAQIAGNAPPDPSFRAWGAYLEQTNNKEQSAAWPNPVPFEFKDREAAKMLLLKAIRTPGVMWGQCTGEYCSRFVIPETVQLTQAGKHAEAFRTVHQAAVDYANTSCATMVGQMIVKGEGAPRDLTAARGWFEIAALPYDQSQVVAVAKMWLGEMYRLGKGGLSPNANLASCLYSEVELFCGPDSMNIAQVRTMPLGSGLKGMAARLRMTPERAAAEKKMAEMEKLLLARA